MTRTKGDFERDYPVAFAIILAILEPPFFLGLSILLIPIGLFCAYCDMRVWNWFVAPYLHLPEEEPSEPWLNEAANPPSPVRVIEVTPQVRAKDEADRAAREKARLAAVSWRKPEALHATELAKVKLPVDYRFEDARRRARGRSRRHSDKRQIWGLR